MADVRRFCGIHMLTPADTAPGDVTHWDGDDAVLTIRRADKEAARVGNNVQRNVQTAADKDKEGSGGRGQLVGHTMLTMTAECVTLRRHSALIRVYTSKAVFFVAVMMLWGGLHHAALAPPCQRQHVP